MAEGMITGAVGPEGLEANLSAVAESGDLQTALDAAEEAGVSRDAVNAFANLYESMADNWLAGIGVTREQLAEAPAHIKTAAIQATLNHGRNGLRAVAALYSGKLK